MLLIPKGGTPCVMCLSKKSTPRRKTLEPAKGFADSAEQTYEAIVLGGKHL